MQGNKREVLFILGYVASLPMPFRCNGGLVGEVDGWVVGARIPGQFCAGVCKLAGASWGWGGMGAWGKGSGRARGSWGHGCARERNA